MGIVGAPPVKLQPLQKKNFSDETCGYHCLLPKYANITNEEVVPELESAR